MFYILRLNFTNVDLVNTTINFVISGIYDSYKEIYIPYWNGLNCFIQTCLQFKGWEICSDDILRTLKRMIRLVKIIRIISSMVVGVTGWLFHYHEYWGNKPWYLDYVYLRFCGWCLMIIERIWGFKWDYEFLAKIWFTNLQDSIIFTIRIRWIWLSNSPRYMGIITLWYFDWRHIILSLWFNIDMIFMK